MPAVEALQVGDPADDETDVGPVISERERDRILAWIEESKGEVLTGGATTDDGVISPTVIAGPAPDDKVQCEEVFGPVVTLTRVASSTRRSSSRTRRGTACRRRSSRSDLGTSLDAARRLEFGGVIVNEAPTFRADQMPYGGVKASGNTRKARPGRCAR